MHKKKLIFVKPKQITTLYLFSFVSSQEMESGDIKRRTMKLFSDFLIHISAEKRSIGKVRVAETYLAALHSLQTFLGRQDIAFADINSTLLGRYEDWMAHRGLSKNTSSFYMRNLRAVYNRAIAEKRVKGNFPFHDVYTGVGKTRKRAVEAEDIQRLRRLPLSAGSWEAMARDLFLFSYYCRGMSFVDMAYLRPQDLVGGRLYYARRKTGQRLSLRWEPCMQEIVDRYAPNPAGYLLPIITQPGKDALRQYRSKTHSVNTALHALSAQLGIDPPLTTYVARHSWASNAYKMGIPVAIISEALGHDSEKTTRIYLASMEEEKLDAANASLLAFLMCGEG